MTTSEVGAEIVRFFRSFKSVQAQMGHRARHGVDPSAYAVLFQLVESPKRTTELASCLHADTSTVSRQVTSLVDIGLVERTADPEDRRATILVATDAGRAAYDAMRVEPRTDDRADPGRLVGHRDQGAGDGAGPLQRRLRDGPAGHHRRPRQGVLTDGHSHHAGGRRRDRGEPSWVVPQADPDDPRPA